MYVGTIIAYAHNHRSSNLNWASRVCRWAVVLHEKVFRRFFTTNESARNVFRIPIGSLINYGRVNVISSEWACALRRVEYQRQQSRIHRERNHSWQASFEIYHVGQLQSSRVTTHPVYNVSIVITYFFPGPDSTENFRSGYNVLSLQRIFLRPSGRTL